MKKLIGIGFLVIAVAFAVQMLQQSNTQAKTPQKAVAVQIQYAMLNADQEADSVTWLIGGNDRVRTETVKATYRRLGGNGRGTFSDLLNQVGSDGWNLVQKDGNVWIFSRTAP